MDDLSETDRLLVENTVEGVGHHSDIDNLIGIHRRIIAQQERKRTKLVEQLTGIERNIVMREYAVELLHAKQRDLADT